MLNGLVARLKLDCREMICPLPFLKAKQAVASQVAEITILLSDPQSVEDIKHLGNTHSYHVTVELDSDHWRVCLQRDNFLGEKQ